MKKDNKVFKAFYFAMSNGTTTDSQTVFGETGIESVSSPWDNESLNKFKVTTEFKLDEIKDQKRACKLYGGSKMIKIMKYGEVSADEIFARGKTSFDVADIVTDIIENVKENGDKALYEYTEKFDKAKLESLQVTEQEMQIQIIFNHPDKYRWKIREFIE